MTTLQHFRTITQLALDEEAAFAQWQTIWKRHQLDAERNADPAFCKARRKQQHALDALNAAVDVAFPSFFPHLDPSRHTRDAMNARARIFTAVYRTNPRRLTR